MRKLTLVLFCVLVGGSLFAQGNLGYEDNTGARPLGMGRTFVALADDGYAALWNPAGADMFIERTLSGMFSRLYLGLDNDAIYEGFISYTHHFEKTGSPALSYIQLESVRYREMNLALTYSKRLPRNLYPRGMSFGATFHILRNQYIRSNFDYEPQLGDAEHHIGDPLNDPIFRNGWGKTNFTLDFGFLMRLKHNLSLGFAASNILQPDMSLTGDPEAGHYPMTLRFGTAYRYHDFLVAAADLRYINESINGKNRLKPHIGAEWWFSDGMVAIRTGWNPEEYSAGFTYRTKATLDLQLDYAFVYPLSTVRETGATSHKLSATMRFLPPPKPLIDLSLRSTDMSVYPRNAILGEPVTITAKIENLGEKKVSDFKVTLYYQSPDAGWVLVDEPRTIKKGVKVGEALEVSWKWVPPAKGHYQLFSAVDDDGSLIPEISGSLDEIDEENNKGAVELDVFPLPTGTITPEELKLEIAQVTLVREEEPIVPIVFYDPMQTKIDPRFEKLLSTIVNRMSNNPDIELILYGYYDPETEGMGYSVYGEKLAKERALALRSHLLSMNPSLRGRIRVASPTEYDPSAGRAGKQEERLPDDIPRIQAENRRVEIKSRVIGFEDWQASIPFEKNSSKVEKAKLHNLRAKASDIKRILEDNPEAILLFEGLATEDEKDNWSLTFDRAYNAKQALKSILGEEAFERFENRIFIKGNTDRFTEEPKAVAHLSGEGLIYRPMEGTMAAKEYEMEEDQQNFVKVKAEAEAGIDSFRVSIIDEDGNLFRVLAEGAGTPPRGIPWNWKDENGNLLNPARKYFCKLELKDKLGQRFETISDTIRVKVTEREQLTETLILVQFNFDEKVSESKFLESRVEYVARKFIERALEPKKRLVAVVGGHTDVVGMRYRNEELSIERAKKEEANLRQYLIYLLGLSNNRELNSWLRAHNTVLTYRGYRDTKPYVIDKWQEGKFVTEEIGNNELPEGRTINRRVVVEFYMEKAGEKPKELLPPQSLKK